MALFSVPDIKISGIAACVPEDVYQNSEYDWVEEKERATLIRTIGVEQKRHARKGTTTADLCYDAAEKLLELLRWERKDIELVIFVSQSRDYIIPATAGLLQDRLRLSHATMAFDIGLGCSGYVYGLSVIGSLMSTGRIKKALLFTGDISTLNTSFRDKSAFPLFGDAGTATALEYSPDARPMVFNLQTDGSGYDAILIPDGGIRNFADKETSFEYHKISEGIYRNGFNIALDGIQVFNFSLREVKRNVNQLMEFAGTSLDEVDYLVLHQANKLMNETIRKQLKLSPVKVPLSLKEYGNTSSASIPLTMVTQIREELEAGTSRLLLSGFGVGLSWGSVLLETDHLQCPVILVHPNP